MFAQAISSTSATAPCSRNSTSAWSPASCARSDWMPTVNPDAFDERAKAGAVLAGRADAFGVARDDRVAFGLDGRECRAGREPRDAAGELVAALVIGLLFFGEHERHVERGVAVREHEAGGITPMMR